MIKRKICFITAAEITIKAFLLGHLKAMDGRYDITIITDTKNSDFLKPFDLNMRIIPISIKRKISPIYDIVSFLHLFFFFRKNNFDVVHSITPKAGLLSMVAAFFARIPARIHTFTGQVWVTRKGIVRWTLKLADRFIAHCATHILVDSLSQRDFLIREKIVSEVKSQVIGRGSICGVDTKRFISSPTERRNMRDRYSISESDIVFMFLGRLTVDKGLFDLAQAFVKISNSHENACLIIVGPDEGNIKEKMLDICRDVSERIYFETLTDKPEKFMTAADVFCLPSYREGFGMTIIEAASVGIPSIGTRIYGITDAIEENVTGFLYTAGDVRELSEVMLKMMEEPLQRNDMGNKARERVIRLYSREYVTSAFVKFYDEMFSSESEKR